VSVVGSYDRPNLQFAVERFATERDRLMRAVHLLRRSTNSGIVYVPTRNRTDAVAAALRYRGFAAAPYHAGLPSSARRALLARFLDGRIRVMVATNAFGMGIDKPDVRHVIHLGIPTRPEAYYQEAGRAGRDGLPSWCHLLWTRQDLAMMVGMARVDERARGARAKRLRRIRREAVATMRRYVASRRCRRRILLGYFGEVLVSCAGCDRCGPSRRESTWGLCGR
jgi:ATP-dependent DNA helicase RecQ